MVGKLGEVKLKRSPPVVESSSSVKRRKITLNEVPCILELEASKQTIPNKRNVRRIKQNLRRKLPFNSRPLSEPISNMVVVTPQLSENSESMGNSNNAEGESGWPQTALAAP